MGLRQEDGDPEIPKNCGPLYQRGGMLTNKERELSARQDLVGESGVELAHPWMTATLPL